MTRVFVLFGCLLLAAGAVARADRRESAPARTTFSEFPMQLGNWQGIQEPPFTPEVLAVLGVTDYLTRAYFTKQRSAVGLYIGYWQSQRQGDTIHSPLNCLPGAGWEPVSSSRVSLADIGVTQATGTINRYVIQKGLDKQLVLYWYQSHGRIVASEYWGKVYLVTDAVRLNRTDGSIVRVIAPILGTGEDAEARAERDAIGFVKELLPQLNGFLPN